MLMYDCLNKFGVKACRPGTGPELLQRRQTAIRPEQVYWLLRAIEVDM